MKMKNIIMLYLNQICLVKQKIIQLKKANKNNTIILITAIIIIKIKIACLNPNNKILKFKMKVVIKLKT